VETTVHLRRPVALVEYRKPGRDWTPSPVLIASSRADAEEVVAALKAAGRDGEFRLRGLPEPDPLGAAGNPVIDNGSSGPKV
jgi:hypothetical protein